MIFQGQTVENNKRKAFQTEEKFWEKFSEVKKGHNQRNLGLLQGAKGSSVWLEVKRAIGVR